MARSDVTVPVIVDDVKLGEALHGAPEITRCSYFTVECDESAVGSVVLAERQDLRLVFLNYSGVIWRPVGIGDYGSKFASLDAIEGTFEAVEKDGDLFVDTNDIWLPNAVIQPVAREAGVDWPSGMRGQVMRCGLELFSKALQFRQNWPGAEAFRKAWEGVDIYLEVSVDETSAFHAWSEHHIADSIEQYPREEEKGNRLQWK